MKRKLMLLLTCLFIGIGLVTAQVTKVTGSVISEEDGLPVVGASILVKGTTVGTVTDMDGKFTLSNVPSSAKTLVVSFIGMATQDVPVKQNVSVVLKSDTEFLDEVVVTGYGVQRKASFTGAASMVGQDVIAKKSDANFIKSLEGAVPGLQMNNSTGIPGAWGSVNVRGRGSLNSGTQPLYVIDGMPVNSDYDSMSSSGNNFLDPMSALNPTDIESLTVLKDAAATAIYGSRAANGVIVITTKKGSQGKFNLNLDVKQGFVSTANNNMEYANAKEAMNLYANGYTARYGGDFQTNYDKLKTDRFYDWDGETTYDWMDAVTRKGYYQDYNLSGQGRTGSTGYYFSMGYLDTEGLVIGSDLKRYSGRLNLDSKFSVFTFGASASYSNTTQNGFSQSTGGSMSSPTVAAISSMNVLYPFYDEDGNYNRVGSYNPLALYDKEKGQINEVKNQTINLSPYLQIDFGKGIYAKTTLGVNIVDQREYNYWSASYNPQGIDYNGLGMQYNSKSTVITWNNILGWNYTFDKHNVGMMLGQEMQRKDYFYEYYEGYDFPFADSGMRDLTTAGAWGDSEYYKREARLASYFADVHYSYADKYYLSGSFRRDGSSVFGSNSRWGNFWSVGGKWRISGEDFLKDNEIITNATLRASYGTVGNQDIDWYAARGFYVAGANYGNAPGMRPTSIANPDLTWEVSKKFDIGFDLSLINRIHFTFDYYNEKTTDALFKVPLSMTTGLSKTYQNIGSIRNHGVELAVNASIIQNSELTWSAYANLTWNKNEVVKLSTPEPIESTYSIIEEGHPYRQFYMKEYAGVDRETGKPMWYLNKEGNETTTNYNDAAKRYVGAAEPKVLGGFGTSLTWKGIDFSVAFNYRLGGKIYDSAASFTGFGMSYRTPLKEVALNSWTENNKDAKYPQYIYGDPNNATATSSRFLYSGNFLRISNLTLGYTVPSQWTKKAFIQKCRVYVSADNLYTFTAGDFIGYNPETYASGVIAWQYPAAATFIGGIQLTF
ncbi:SusC/RagA family TonB-linked outer membrane protein [Phocaeicola sp.]